MKNFIEKKINVSQGLNRGPPPRPLSQRFPFFLDIELCTQSLSIVIVDVLITFLLQILCLFALSLKRLVLLSTLEKGCRQLI